MIRLNKNLIKKIFIFWFFSLACFFVSHTIQNIIDYDPLINIGIAFLNGVFLSWIIF
jgi:hypothetical protein